MCTKSCNDRKSYGSNQNAINKVEAIDQNNDCSHWASIGECDKNPNYMLPNCTKSCNNRNNSVNPIQNVNPINVVVKPVEDAVNKVGDFFSGIFR
jgi:hypothetical protein